MSRTMLAAAAAVTALAVSACAGQPGDLSAAGETALKPKVQQVRTAAATGSETRLRSAVRSLESAVAQQQTAGHLTAARASAIDDAADTLLNDFTPTPAPATSPPSQSPTPTPTQSSAPATPTAAPTQTPTATPTATSSPQPSTTVSVP